MAQSMPLSATNMPHFFGAFRIVCSTGAKPEMGDHPGRHENDKRQNEVALHGALHPRQHGLAYSAARAGSQLLSDFCRPPRSRRGTRDEPRTVMFHYLSLFQPIGMGWE